MFSRSRVKYNKKREYNLQERVALTMKQKREARKKGKRDAKNPFDVMRDHATEYEKRMQQIWEKQINERTGQNIMRCIKWGDLIRQELNHFVIAKNEFAERLKERSKNLTDSHLSTKAYIIILCLITLAEMPINIKVFDVFGENLIFTCLLGGLLSIVFAMIAHFVGGWIKMGGRFLQSFTLIFIVIILMAIISYIRIVFFKGEEFSVVNEYFKTGLQLGVILGLFYTINILLFSISVIASIQAHDSDPVFINAKKRYDLAHSKLSKLLSARAEEIVNLRRVIGKCQEAFKEQRHIYVDAYTTKLKNKREPQCFKESITVEQERIKGLEEEIRNIEKEFETQKNEVERLLVPIAVENYQ